jgi:TIR domain
MQTEPTAVISIFASYAPQDTPLQRELKEHLRPLQRAGLIELWPDRDMSAGTEWEQQSSQLFHAAQIILLLVSIDYLNSDYCSGVEMKQALERHERGEVWLLPLLVRPCFWNRSPLGKLQVLPNNGQPVTTWANREEAWLDVVQALSRVIDETLQQPKGA